MNIFLKLFWQRWYSSSRYCYLLLTR